MSADEKGQAFIRARRRKAPAGPGRRYRRTRLQVWADRVLAGCACVLFTLACLAALGALPDRREQAEPTFRWACQEDELLVPYVYPPRTQRDLRCVNREEIPS